MDDETPVEVFNDDNSSIDDSGDAEWVTDANLPGDTQGETNGLYAGVTTNRVNPGGYDYIAANPGGRTNLLDSFRSIVDSTGAAVRSVSNQVAATRQVQARAAYLKQQGYKPTIAEQWAALSPFEQIGFASAVVGFIWFFSRKAS